jgi:hypothetical protein
VVFPVLEPILSSYQNSTSRSMLLVQPSWRQLQKPQQCRLSQFSPNNCATPFRCDWL